MIQPDKMQIDERGSYAVVYPRGYLNGPLGEAIDTACGDLLRKGLNRILVNFSEIETMNTMGVSSLISVLEKAGRRGGVVCFSNLLQANRMALDVLDLSRAVLIFEDEESASKHLQSA